MPATAGLHASQVGGSVPIVYGAFLTKISPDGSKIVYSTVIAGEDVAVAAQFACLLEVSAPKPGNVSPALHFHDTRYEDFLASAAAIGPAMATSGTRPLGATKSWKGT